MALNILLSLESTLDTINAIAIVDQKQTHFISYSKSSLNQIELTIIMKTKFLQKLLKDVAPNHIIIPNKWHSTVILMIPIFKIFKFFL